MGIKTQFTLNKTPKEIERILAAANSPEATAEDVNDMLDLLAQLPVFSTTVEEEKAITKLAKDGVVSGRTYKCGDVSVFVPAILELERNPDPSAELIAARPRFLRRGDGLVYESVLKQVRSQAATGGTGYMVPVSLSRILADLKKQGEDVKEEDVGESMSALRGAGVVVSVLGSRHHLHLLGSDGMTKSSGSEIYFYVSLPRFLLGLFNREGSLS